MWNTHPHIGIRKDLDGRNEKNLLKVSKEGRKEGRVSWSTTTKSQELLENLK